MTPGVTLFVDESGDFETVRGRPWVVAGVAVMAHHGDAERELAEALGGIVREYGIMGPGDLHLTDVRRRSGAPAAASLANHLLAAGINSRVSVKYAATTNPSHKRVADRETTYRVMLQDLIALVEAAGVFEEPVERISLVVATRRTVTGSALTTAEEIQEDSIDSLRHAIEVGLASRGLYELLGSDRLELLLYSARHRWGLALADVLSNLVHNQDAEECGAVVQGLLRGGHLHLFRSGSNVVERRARVAERDRDYALALACWCEMLAAPGQQKDVRTWMSETWRRVLTEQGSRGPAATVEAVGELVWRGGAGNCGPGRRAKAFETLEATLADAAAAAAGPFPRMADALRFRLRVLRVRSLLRRGDYEESCRLLEEDRSILPGVTEDPSIVTLLFDWHLLRVEMLINGLQLHDARSAAERLARMHGDYQTLIAMMLEGNQGASSISSTTEHFRENVVHLHLRTRTLCLKRGDMSAEPLEAELRKEIECTSRWEDRDRLLIQLSALLLRASTPERAVIELQHRAVDAMSQKGLPFIAMAYARAWAQTAMNTRNRNAPQSELLEWFEQAAVGLGNDHPAESLWRDLGVLHALRGADDRARAAFHRARHVLSTIVQGPLALWQIELLAWHRQVLLREKGPVQWQHDLLAREFNLRTIGASLDSLQHLRVLSPL